MKKKIVMVLLTVVAGVCLFGCGAGTKEESAVAQEDVAVILREESAPTAQTAEELIAETMTVEESTVEEKLNIPEILITSIEEVWYTEDGTQVLLTSSCCKAEVTNEGFENLAQALDEWSGLVYSEVLAMSEEYASWAAENFALAETPESFEEFYTDFGLGTQRVDDVILSFAGGHDAYVGGAHGFYSFVGYTFDVETGEIISLDRLIADDENFQEAAIDRILSVLESEEYAEWLYDDYESTVRGMFAQDGYVSWFLNDEGIVITFDPYEIGPYAMPEIRVTLPYEEFSQYMAIKYRL